VPKPSNIGSDETFELGSVFAKADARTRGGLPGGPLAPSSQNPAAPAAPAAPGATVDLPGAALPAAPGLSVIAPGAAAGGPDAAPPNVSMSRGLALTARTSSLLPDSARDGYRLVLLVAAVAVGSVVHVIRKSPLA
jgi:hypothetical protein